MTTLLQVDFEFHGPFGKEMTTALTAIAESINQEPGFIWKIWTINEKTHEAGGVYLFASEETATAYLDMHTTRLNQMGITAVRGKTFDINDDLSMINKAPIH